MSQMIDIRTLMPMFFSRNPFTFPPLGTQPAQAQPQQPQQQQQPVSHNPFVAAVSIIIVNCDMFCNC